MEARKDEEFEQSRERKRKRMKAVTDSQFSENVFLHTEICRTVKMNEIESQLYVQYISYTS